MYLLIPDSLLKSKKLTFADKLVLALIAEDCHVVPYFEMLDNFGILDNSKIEDIDNSIEAINKFQKSSMLDMALKIGAGLATIKRSVIHLQDLHLIEIKNGKRRLAPLFFKIKFDDNE